MTYHQFLNYVKEQSVYELDHPEEYQASINHVIKNNAVELDGICLHKYGEQISPTVYLNPFYEQYLDGRPIKSILNEIVTTIHDDVPKLELPADVYDNYDAIRPQIIYRIVHYQKNKEQLATCPYLPFCDLAITFRWLVHADTSGIASSLITNRELELWNVTVEELYQAARYNTQRLFPHQITPLQELLSEYFQEDPELQSFYDSSSPALELFILTNQLCINGSTCMIYDNVLPQFAKQQSCDLYILPSSVHEVLLIPARYEIDEEHLLHLVHDANRTVVSKTEVLSDSVYRYERESNRVSQIENHWNHSWFQGPDLHGSDRC